MKADDLLSQLHGQVQEMVTGDDWLQMMQQVSRFHNYSASNVLLITLQCPHATRVAGYKKWLEFNRFVRKGEKGIAILAPMLVKDKEDPKKMRLRGFRTAFVFDVSQTEGEPLLEPPRPQLLAGQAPDGLIGFLTDAIKAEGFSIYFPGPAAWDGGRANGYTNFADNRVVIRPGLSDAQMAKTTAHELGHVIFKHSTEGHRGKAEVEAESFSYLISVSAGIDSGSYAVPYVAQWSGGDVKLVLQTANRVASAAHPYIEKWEEKWTTSRAGASARS